MDTTEPTNLSPNGVFDVIDAKLNEVTTKPAFAREAIMLCTNMGLYTMDMLRYFSHQPKTPHDPLALNIPRQTEGITGLIDQHMGDLGFTLALIYAARIPVEIGAKIYEAIWDKKVNPRIKLYLAVLAGMAWPTMGELGKVPFPGTNEPADLFGIMVAGIVVTAGYETAEFLSKKSPTYWNQKFADTINRIKPIAEAVTKKYKGIFPA